MITCAASLVHHGVLRSVRRIGLVRVDLTSVPTEHLASLVSSAVSLQAQTFPRCSVRGSVTIKNVSGCDLVTILDSVKSKALSMGHQSLGSEETRALVRAMESRVEEVHLCSELTLDMRVLMEYNGQGKCTVVHFRKDFKDRYREQLKTWDTDLDRNWESYDSYKSYWFCMERNIVSICSIFNF